MAVVLRYPGMKDSKKEETKEQARWKAYMLSTVSGN